MTQVPFVGLMKKYCIDYTSAHNQDVCDEIMREDYVVNISGMKLVRDGTYKPTVTLLYQDMPGLQICVHDIITNGDRLAMRFSEHGVSLKQGKGNAAAWEGIGVYKWDGAQLTENYVEQNFLSKSQQLASGTPAPVEPPHLDPWFGTQAQPSNPQAEAIVREWLAAGDLRSTPSLLVDGAWRGDTQDTVLAYEDHRENDLFSAGNKVAFHIRQSGAYRGGLLPDDEELIGTPMKLNVVGIVEVENGQVARGRIVTDRFAAAQVLSRKLQET